MKSLAVTTFPKEKSYLEIWAKKNYFLASSYKSVEEKNHSYPYYFMKMFY